MTIDAGAQDASPVTLAAARAEFDVGLTYLDTATFGLPPWRSCRRLRADIADGTGLCRLMRFRSSSCRLL